MKFKLLKSVAVLSLCAITQSAQATVFYFKAKLDGLAEAPPNVSPGLGSAEVWIDDVANTLRLMTGFSGLIGTVTAAHIHAPTALPDSGTAGVATQVPTLLGFPLGVTSGSYDHTFDLTVSSTYNSAYVTANGGTVAGAQVALTNALMESKAYLNIHTTEHPGGEIRGFFVQQAQVPDAGSNLALLGLGLFGLCGCARLFGRRKRCP